MVRSCFLVWMIFLLRFIHTISPSIAITNITTDQSALLALKASIIDDPQNILASNWSTSTPVCNWVGVTCGVRHQRVTILNVSYFGLTGTIPPQIGNLSFLTDLLFRNNSFHGSLPIELTHLRRLKRLTFGYNKFTGEIPSWFWSFSRLELLYLYGNQFSGSITKEIRNATKLKELWLFKNRLTGEIPPEIGKLELEILSIFSNSFTGPFPSTIYNMSSLKILDLSDSFYGNILPDNMCDTLPNLEELYLHNCQLQGGIPSQLSQCGKLSYLELGANNLTGWIPLVLFNMSHLDYFQISKNNFEATILPDNLCQNLPNLWYLSMEDCSLGGLIPTQLSQCGKLRVISLASNNFIGSIPHTIGNLTNLRALFLNDNNLTEWRRVSYHELMRITNEFSETNLLGTGSFGSVYQGKLNDGMDVAVKAFNLTIMGGFKSFETECKILSGLRHRNLIKVISVCSNIDFKALVLQYMPHGSLEKWLHSNNLSLTLLQRLNIMIDVASAVEYLHHGYSESIVHCDIKPTNVLLSTDMVAHVADFGIAKLVSGSDSITQTITLATIGYMAPEYGLEGVVSTRGDMYSYGILLMETFTGKKPTDAMFVGDLSLKKWVEDALANFDVTNVADASVLEGQNLLRVKECLSSIFKLALCCTTESPVERKNMKEISTQLNKVKLRFLQDV